MKVLYSQIKAIVPDLKADAREVGEVLTMTGFLMDSLTEVKFQGKKDWLIGLEVRQNRGDCLSVLGVAREVSAYYGLASVLPDFAPLTFGVNLPIKVRAVDNVKRILAVRLENVKNNVSPDWLKEFLAFYEINSVNLLVDLSNYVMIYTGYTSHLLDADLIAGDVVWEINNQEQVIKTLDGSEVKLAGGELVIADSQNILALAGIVGALPAAIKAGTKNLIAEMAIYDRFIVKQNSRALGIMTEASNRLSKDMSTRLAEYAFMMLVAMLAKETGAQVVGPAFDYWPEPQKPEPIAFDPQLASRLAGIEISKEKAQEILENLRCQVLDNNQLWQVTPPPDRLDLELAEDLAEEVIRLNRYDAIPSDITPNLEVTIDITPKLWSIKEWTRNFLVASGYDEILSQPLVALAANEHSNWLGWEQIVTQNSVNEEYPALRQSIAVGLLNQLAEYEKKNVWPIKVFEIGKIFGQEKDKISETEALGALWIADKADLSAMQADLTRLALTLGAVITFAPAKKPAGFANPYSCFTILSNNQAVGCLAKLKPIGRFDHLYYFELNLGALNFVPALAGTELTKKLVALDANLELANKADLAKELAVLAGKIGSSLWDLSIIDIYPVDDKTTRYTVRAVYSELTDQEAKEVHARIFSIK